MAIKLEVYLKRTEQTLEAWMDANGITEAKELLPRSGFLGLAAAASDVALATEIFKKRKQKAKDEAAAARVQEPAVQPEDVKKRKPRIPDLIVKAGPHDSDRGDRD